MTLTMVYYLNSNEYGISPKSIEVSQLDMERYMRDGRTLDISGIGSYPTDHIPIITAYHLYNNEKYYDRFYLLFDTANNKQIFYRRVMKDKLSS